MKDFSYVLGQDPEYIESLYIDYLKESSLIDPEWKKFFEGFDFAVSSGPQANGLASNGSTAPFDNDTLVKELAVFELIRAYRKRGHLEATTNPIRTRKDRHPQLEPELFKLTPEDQEKTFDSGKFIDTKR